MNNLKQRILCQCWLLPALAALLVLPLIGEARIVFVQLPPSPSLGLVQDINGNWVDPFASYDSQGLRLWGTAENPATYNLVLNGQVAFTFASQDSGFDLAPAGINRVIGGYLDGAGAVGAVTLPSDTTIGPDPGAYAWFSHDQAVGGTLGLATARASGIIGSPILFTGPFAGIQSAFIGLQFQVDGQTYYGWVRVGAPVSINGGWIYDYAYETSPDTPINAGQTNELIYFEATFNGGNEVPPNKSTHSGNGVFVLEGNILSCNLTLDGSFAPTSARIFGPANPNMNSSRLVADLGNASISNLSPIPFPPIGPVTMDIKRTPTILQPPIVLVYSGQITLSSNQVAELLAGQLYANFKSARFRQGELRGEILATMPIQFAATLSGRNEMPRDPRHPRNPSPPQGEAGFTLTGNRLTCEVALDVNFASAAVGIYTSSSAIPFNLIAKLDATIGVTIPDGGLPNAPGLPGQVLYSGNLTLTDRQVSQIKSGQFYINARTSRTPRAEISGRILPAE